MAHSVYGFAGANPEALVDVVGHVHAHDSALLDGRNGYRRRFESDVRALRDARVASVTQGAPLYSTRRARASSEPGRGT